MTTVFFSCYFSISDSQLQPVIPALFLGVVTSTNPVFVNNKHLEGKGGGGHFFNHSKYNLSIALVVVWLFITALE